MPDTQAADVVVWVGSFIGTAVAAWGLRRGERDKKTAPAPSPEFAGIAATLVDRKTLTTLEEAIRDLVDEMRMHREGQEIKQRVRLELAEQGAGQGGSEARMRAYIDDALRHVDEDRRRRGVDKT